MSTKPTNTAELSNTVDFVNWFGVRCWKDRLFQPLSVSFYCAFMSTTCGYLLRETLRSNHVTTGWVLCPRRHLLSLDSAKHRGSRNEVGNFWLTLCSTNNNDRKPAQASWGLCAARGKAKIPTDSSRYNQCLTNHHRKLTLILFIVNQITSDVHEWGPDQFKYAILLNQYTFTEFK